MARVSLTVQQILGPFPTLPVDAGGLDAAFTAADAANGNDFTATGFNLLLAKNTGAGARTVTFFSVTDQYNRTGDVTAYSIGAGEIAVFYFGPAPGWSQSTGKINVTAEHAEVELAVLDMSQKFAER